MELEINQIESIKNSYKLYCKMYREEHKDKIKKSHQKWYLANKDNEEFHLKVSEYSKQYYKNKTVNKPKRESQITDEQKAKKKEYNRRYQDKIKLKNISNIN
tara:strand:- start:660 stop:965 length:306 start_codon:yes stop_codon:yes gene_type:complete